MGKKYLDTKQNTLEAAVLQVWQVAAEEMDPVNPKAAAKKFKDRKDKDIDNDGDVDDSDEYLHKRRKAIGKAMKSEGKENVNEVLPALAMMAAKPVAKMVAKKVAKKAAKVGASMAAGAVAKKAIGKAMKKNKDTPEMRARRDGMTEGLEDSPNPANSQHLCAKNVVHEEWGEGQPVHGMHAMPDVDGNIAWYDVMFEHGIEKGVSINELKVTVAERHHNHGGKKKKNEGAMKRGKDMDTFKPKPQEPQNEIIGTAAKLAGKAVGGAAKLAGRTAGTAAKVAGRTVSGVAKGAGSAAAGAIKGTKKAVGGAVKGATKAVGGAASATKKAGSALMNSEELEMRDYNEYQNFKVQSMRDALEEVWEISADEKLFEDIELMTEEQYDEFLDSLNEEEVNEIIRAIGRGIKKVATMGTAASRADRAEKKLAKAQARQDKIDKKATDKARIATAKAKTAELRAKNPTLGMKAKAAAGSAAKRAGAAAGSAAKRAGSAIMGR